MTTLSLGKAIENTGLQNSDSPTGDWGWFSGLFGNNWRETHTSDLFGSRHEGTSFLAEFTKAICSLFNTDEPTGILGEERAA